MRSFLRVFLLLLSYVQSTILTMEIFGLFKTAKLLVNKLTSFELRLISTIQRILHPHLDNHALMITDAGLSIILPSILWMTTAEHAVFLVACSSVAEFVNAIFKWIWQRPRPFWVSETSWPIVNIEGAWESDFSSLPLTPKS
jgi:hypothetical protein